MTAVEAAQLDIARRQLAAAWATVDATWAGALLSALVIGTAFITIALQRYLDRRKSERQRQYNNLSILVEAMFAINYIEFCFEYLGEACRKNNIVSKYPIIFHLTGYARGLEVSSADRDVGPGPTGVASRVIVICQTFVAKMTGLCVDDTFTADQMIAARAFITTIRPDLAGVWEALSHHHQNIVSTREGVWAVDEFCRRGRTLEGGRNVIEMLKAGSYSKARSDGLIHSRISTDG